MLGKSTYPRITGTLWRSASRLWRTCLQTGPIAAAALALVGCDSFFPSADGRAVRVLDGDSVILRVADRQLEARLQGIDAPEHRQHYGEKAKAELRDLVMGHPLEIQVTDTDRYGRSVVLLRRADTGLFVNEELIRRGAAWAHRRYGLPGWRSLEAEAKKARSGLWARANPQPPWEWRERNGRRQ